MIPGGLANQPPNKKGKHYPIDKAILHFLVEKRIKELPTMC